MLRQFNQVKLVVFCAGVALAGFVCALWLTNESQAATAVRIRATVDRIVDGDTIVVRYGRKTDKVRVLGIDAPEKGHCYAAAATAASRRLLRMTSVGVTTDSSQATRDRYGRLLAYVAGSSGDLGLALVKGGYAKVYVYNGVPFARARSYQRAEAEAKTTRRGLWAACGAGAATTATPGTATATTKTPTTTARTTTATATTATATTNAVPPTTTAGNRCDAAYPTVCIPPPPPDLDCGQISYKRFTVLAPDPHRFDGDHDGIGCES